MSTDTSPPSPTEALAAFNQHLLEQVLKPLGDSGAPVGPEFLQSLTAGLAANTESWTEIQNRYYQKQLELWQSFASSESETPPEPVVKPEPGDRRFRSPEWQQPFFSLLAQSYLLNSRWLTELVDHAQVDERTRRKLSFYARQYIDALSPANFPWSNPEALKLAAETKGASLTRGLTHLAADLKQGLVSMTDATAFEVGRDLAITPGSVVYENEFFQLIQYAPLTEKVFSRPLVMIPPCINKFYILDLQPGNSFVRYAVAEGHTVFMVSWRNMPDTMGRATWDDYLQQGVIRAMEVSREIAGVQQCNVLGFCVGGTLLGCALAVLASKGDKSVRSATFLTTMLDFSDTGELSVFVDESYVLKRELDFAQGGLLPGRELALTFASLRANDLIWQYVVNNYLKGKTPDPFDLLYWNSDSTNLPGAMYAYYVRNMYLENNLRSPGKLKMCGVPVDLSRVRVPAYVLAAREDHIVPWRTAYSSAQLVRGDVNFVLSASGHIAGVVNPASRDRRNYWTGEDLPEEPDSWLNTAQSQPGSWWKHWSPWLAKHGGRRVPSRKPGSKDYPEIEPAPGRYVKEPAQPSRVE